MMKFFLRPLAVALIVLGAAAPSFDTANAQSFSPEQRGEIEKVIRDYLLRNPELLQEVIQEMVKIMSEDYGNPSSTHSFGRAAKNNLELSRKETISSDRYDR